MSLANKTNITSYNMKRACSNRIACDTDAESGCYFLKCDEKGSKLMLRIALDFGLKQIPER